MKKFLVQFDESNIGVAWSKGDIIEAETKEDAIEKAVKSKAKIWFDMNAMLENTALYLNKSIYEYENDQRSYNWKATEI